MSSRHIPTISFGAALLTNLNIMIGVGIFVNTAPLIKEAGALSPLSYLIVGFLMLPLILAINKLMTKHKGGNFYTFGAENLSPTWGFLSVWSYFVGKLASCSLMIHFFSSLMQKLIPSLNIFSTIWLDLLVILFLTLLNCLNTRIGTLIQLLIFIVKISPIIFIILGGFYIFDFTSFQDTSSSNAINNLLPTISFVVYAFTGFEATCSLSSCIKNPEKNCPRAILTAFFIVVMLTILYQFCSFVIAGNSLSKAASFTDAFAILAKGFSANFIIQNKIGYFLQITAAISALGAAYGVFYSNNRNLYSLAQEGHIFFSRYFMHLNQNHIPWLSVLVQAFGCILYLLFTRGNNIPLQQMSAVGCTLAYFISCIGLVKHGIRRNFIGLLGLISAGLLLLFSLSSAIQTSTFALALYCALLLSGLLMFHKV